MWPSSPVPPCCRRVWCVAGRPLATRLFLLTAEVGISAVYVWPSGLQERSCRLVMSVLMRPLVMFLVMSFFPGCRAGSQGSIFKMWERDNTVHGLDLPYPLCKQLLSLLILSTKQLPLSQRSLNSFHVSYSLLSRVLCVRGVEGCRLWEGGGGGGGGTGTSFCPCVCH